MNALGLIEVYGYLAAVEALDSALKAANVRHLSTTKVKGGLVTVMVTGDVGAVKAAIDASAAAAGRVGRVVSVHVIPRPSAGVEKMLSKGNTANNAPKPPTPTTPPQGGSVNAPQAAPALAEKPRAVSETKAADVGLKAFTAGDSSDKPDDGKGAKAAGKPQTTPKKDSGKQKNHEDTKAKRAAPEKAVSGAAAGIEVRVTREEMERMKVVELRALARDMKLPSMSKRDIRFANKQDLMKNILEFLDGRDD